MVAHQPIASVVLQARLMLVQQRLLNDDSELPRERYCRMLSQSDYDGLIGMVAELYFTTDSIEELLAEKIRHACRVVSAVNRAM